MLTEPVNGCCKFLLFDFEVQMSCAGDIPVNLAGWVNWYPAEILEGPDAGREEMLRTFLADTREALAVYAEKGLGAGRLYSEKRGRCYE